MRRISGSDRNRTVGVRPALICISLAAAVLLFGCGSSGTSPATTRVPGTVAQASPVAPEDNPPGDVPDSQAFVPYHSVDGGYTLQVPEGWARSESGPNVSFSDKLDSITINVTPGAAAPTVDTVTANELARLQQQVEAFEQVDVKAVDLPAGTAIQIRYRWNSPPDAVTGTKVRLETNRFELFKDGQTAALSLSAPAGSDNVDVWNQISESFAWD